MGTALQKSLGLHGLLLILLWLLVPGPNPGPASSPDALVIRPVELARPEPPPRLEMPNPARPEPRPAAR
ncbi:MAG: hypothetical protein KC910_25170, partial [Candidatus Eremiobacteraeota bacterium]|nr:hypothetical protein [Candidatus Eremiobacteraeota bacterium]